MPSVYLDRDVLGCRLRDLRGDLAERIRPYLDDPLHTIPVAVRCRAGGRGAVREVCDMVMRAQGNYDTALAPYFA